MKRIAILGGIAALVGVGAWGYLMTPSEMEVRNFTPEVVTETVVEDALQLRIEEAQEEAKDEIEAKLETYRQELLRAVADEVKVEYIAEIEATISDESY